LNIFLNIWYHQKLAFTACQFSVVQKQLYAKIKQQDEVKTKFDFQLITSLD